MTESHDRLRVGMIGLNVSGSGWAAEAHAPAVAAVDGLELAAVATRKQDSADAAATAFGIPEAYGDPQRMIDEADLDIVAVVSPVPTHRELIHAALRAGRHVITEWPVAVGAEQIAELADAVDAAGVRTAVNLQARISAAAVAATRAVADGRLGRILGTTVVSTTAGFGPEIPAAYLPLEDPSTWMNLGTIQTAHTLDLVTSIVGPLEGAEPLLDIQFPQVVVDGERTIDRVLADHVLVQGRITDRGTVSVEVAGGRPADGASFRLDIVGEKGRLTLSGGAPRGFQAGRLELTTQGIELDAVVDPFDGLPASVINTAHTYAALRDDIRDGSAVAPTFRQAAALAVLLGDLGIGV